MPVVSDPEHILLFGNNRQTYMDIMNHPCQSAFLNLLFYLHVYTITVLKGKVASSVVNTFKLKALL